MQKNKNEIKLKNNKQGGALGVFEETAELKKVLMWGAPGTETVLGQLLPVKVSCFQRQFNLPKARAEFENVENILAAQGVEVIMVKDLLAKMIEGLGLKPKLSYENLRKKIERRARFYGKKYGKKAKIGGEDPLDWLDLVLEADVKKYGRATATLVNEIVSLRDELPLSNLLYARDQSNLLGKTQVWSAMQHQIRQPEVHLFKAVLNFSELFDSRGIEQVQICGRGRFEGGDGIANDGIFYVGAGGRTNKEGVLQASESIISKGGRVMMVHDAERDGGSNEMDAMHLDTFWMPVGKNMVVACEEEVKRRKIFEVEGDPLTGLKLVDKGWFMDHLEKRGVELIPLTKDEQLAYAPNLLNLGRKRIILSLAEGNRLTGELQKRGFEVFNADLKEITKGYGGLHCSTAAISRE